MRTKRTKMRIRLLKDIPILHHRSGEVVTITEELAKRWIGMGYAMQDKSMEPSEAK
jgi:hypothetical protein